MKKSKVMIIGENNHQGQWLLNNKILEQTTSYVYLGETIKNNLSLWDHISRVKQKAFAIYNTISAIAQDQIMSKIQVKSLIHMYSRCLLPAILYNAETWLPTKEEFKELDKIQLILLRKIIKAPNSTPITALYLELGILPLHYQIKQRQLMYIWKVANSKNISHNILRNNVTQCSKWFQYITKIASNFELNVDICELQKIKKIQWKKITNAAIQKSAREVFREDANKKSKLTRLLYRVQKKNLPGYMEQLPRDLAAAIFRIRTRTTNVRDNQTNDAPVCKHCKKGLESDKHMFRHCEKFITLREKYLITDIHDDIFCDNGEMDIIIRHAQFAIHAGIVPGCLDPFHYE